MQTEAKESFKQQQQLNQQIIEPVNRIKIPEYILRSRYQTPERIKTERVFEAKQTNRVKDTFRSGIDSDVLLTSSQQDRLRNGREKEWESTHSKPENPKKIEIEPDRRIEVSNIKPLGDQCELCVYPENFLSHYYRRQCKPFFSRECNCAKYFQCDKKPILYGRGKIVKIAGIDKIERKFNTFV